MRLLDATEVKIEWTDITRWAGREHKAYSQIRASGVHVSDIIRYNYFGHLDLGSDERKKKEMEAAEDLGDPTIMPLRMCIGMAVENWLVGLYPDLNWQPGGLSKDGISGSIDGFSMMFNINRLLYPNPDGSFAIEEIKVTWKSFRNREILREVIWMWQLAAYCYIWDTRLARLHVVWVNGDYSHGENWGPRYFRYLIEFKSHELDRLWKSLFLKNREQALLMKKES